MTEQYLEIKRKIDNISNIPFDSETWIWYVNEGLYKKINTLKPIERELIKQFAHSKRAIGILKRKN